MKESTEQLRRSFPADAQSAKVLKPGDGAFDLPSAIITPKRTTILRDVLKLPVAAVWGDHLNPLLGQLFIKSIAVVRFITNHARRRFGGQHEVEQVLNELTLVRTGRGRIDRYRQPACIHQNHYFHAFSGLRAADAVATAASSAKRAVDETLVQPKAAKEAYIPDEGIH